MGFDSYLFLDLQITTTISFANRNTTDEIQDFLTDSVCCFILTIVSSVNEQTNNMAENCIAVYKKSVHRYNIYSSIFLFKLPNFVPIVVSMGEQMGEHLLTSKSQL